MSWKTYHKKWKKAGDEEFKIANSLSKKNPYGVNPVTKKPYSSSKAFARALSEKGKTKDSYMRITKRFYKKETGKDW